MGARSARAPRACPRPRRAASSPERRWGARHPHLLRGRFGDRRRRGPSAWHPPRRLPAPDARDARRAASGYRNGGEPARLDRHDLGRARPAAAHRRRRRGRPGRRPDPSLLRRTARSAARVGLVVVARPRRARGRREGLRGQRAHGGDPPGPDRRGGRARARRAGAALRRPGCGPRCSARTRRGCLAAALPGCGTSRTRRCAQPGARSTGTAGWERPRPRRSFGRAGSQRPRGGWPATRPTPSPPRASSAGRWR